MLDALQEAQWQCNSTPADGNAPVADAIQRVALRRPGSKVMRGPPVVMHHEGVLKALLSHGANIQARDVAGYTPLHHALSSPNNDMSRALGVVLLDHGADIDAQTRFGSPPIHESIMSADKITFTLLLDRNARLDIKDNDDCNPATTPVACKPWFSEQIFKRTRADAKESLAVKPGERKCANTGCKQLGTKRCQRCARVWYCGRDCQVGHWKSGHKAECSGGQNEECVVSLNAGTGWNGTISLTGRGDTSRRECGEVMVRKAVAAHPKEEKFKVKVQVPMGGNLGQMIVYDKERSFTLTLMPTVCNAPRVHALVRQYGAMDGLKGYLYAYIRGTDLHIIIQEPLPKPCLW